MGLGGISVYVPKAQTICIKELEKFVSMISRKKKNLVEEKKYTPTLMLFVQIKGQ